MCDKHLSCSSVLARLIALLLAVALLGVDSYGGEFPAENAQDARYIVAQIRAAQFLSKATFGPTQDGIDELATRITQVGYRRACEQWIDEQCEIPMSSQEQVARDMFTQDGRFEGTRNVDMHLYRYQAWWHIALARPDQLRQRVAWALSQIFVISDSEETFNSADRRDLGGGERSIADWLGMSVYYDMLASHAFGDYRELLGDVTFNPCMGIYLSSFRNQKADISAGRYPDENYAREIMQLFSIGLHELHPDGRLKTDIDGETIPTYDNDDIKEVARLFTGFYGRHNKTGFSAVRNYGEPMQMYRQRHDNNRNYAEDPNNPGNPDPNSPRRKTILGQTLSPLPSPLTNEACLAEVNEGLDVIANHENVPPFICRLLIQRLVKSNPSRAYIRRVTARFQDNGQGIRGDLKAVIKAILLDPELLRGQRVRRQLQGDGSWSVGVVTRGTEYSRLREPINRFAAWIRAMRPTSDYPKNDPQTGEPYMMSSYRIRNDDSADFMSVFGQMPYRAPSVFSFYLPDHQPAGDLVGYRPSRRVPRGALYAPEFQLMNAVSSNKTIQEFWTICAQRYAETSVQSGNCRISFTLRPEILLARDEDDYDEILRRFDLLLCNGSLKQSTKEKIIAAVKAHSSDSNSNQRVIRLESMLMAVVTSPECAIEE